MTQKRKRYDKQFKIAAARVVLGGEMRAVDLARELGIKNSTLGRWAQEHGGDGRERLPRKRQPEGQQGLRDREAPQKGRGARARERAAKKFPGLLESRSCARRGFPKEHRGEFGLRTSTTLNPEPTRCAVRPAPNERVPSMPTTRQPPGPPMASARSRYPLGVAGSAPSRTFLPKASMTHSSCASLCVSTPATTGKASDPMQTTPIREDSGISARRPDITLKGA